MSTATCQFADIEKHYRERRVLAIDSLTLQPGCLHHLTGCNGAGKTTLLRILAGLEPPDRGLVQWNGCQRPWTEMRPYLQREVIYLHQRPFMFDASVTANLDYGLRVTGVARAERRRRIAAALERMALERLAQRHARTLSGGEQQRLALARAWVLRPRLLLLDEPTANLDPAFRRETWDLLHGMRHRDLAILICSHELDTTRWPDMINLHLQDGRLTPARPPLYPVPAGSTAPPSLQGVLP